MFTLMSYLKDLMKTFFECPVSIADAALGTSIEIPTIDGGKAIKIRRYSKWKTFRLKERNALYERMTLETFMYKWPLKFQYH